MPVHDSTKDGQGTVSHHWSGFIFDAIEKANDFAALDLVDLPRSQVGVDQALEGTAVESGGT